MLLEHPLDFLHRFRSAFGRLPKETKGVSDELRLGGLRLTVFDVAKSQILLVAEFVVVPEEFSKFHPTSLRQIRQTAHSDGICRSLDHEPSCRIY